MEAMELLVEGFEDDDGGDDSLGLTPVLETWTTAGNAFSVPWSHEVKAVLTGFKSTLMKEPSGPWLVTCPFDATSLMLTTVLPESGGGVTSYRDGMSTQAGSSSEHLSVELAVTVGYPVFLLPPKLLRCSPSVKVSRNSSCRMGRIILADTPHFSAAALNILRSQGPAKFAEIYGDYYIAGYELGADAGACLSAANSSTSKQEALKITVSVKVLWKKASVSHTESWSSASSSSSFRFSGYCTLDNKSESLDLERVSMQDQARLQAAAQLYLLKVSALGNEIKNRMAEFKLADGKRFPLNVSSAVCQSGLVVGLLLEPFERLSQYQQNVKRR